MRSDELSAVLTRLGHSIEPDDNATTTDVRRYRVAETGTRIFVVADPDPYGYGGPDPDAPGPRAGDVRSLSLSPSWWRSEN